MKLKVSLKVMYRIYLINCHKRLFFRFPAGGFSTDIILNVIIILLILPTEKIIIPYRYTKRRNVETRKLELV